MLDDTAAVERAARWREQQGVTDVHVRFMRQVLSQLDSEPCPMLLVQRLFQDRPDLSASVCAIGMRVILSATRASSE